MSDIREYRPLILRSNRFLGSVLVERGLVSSEDLEAANEKLLELIQSGDIRGASLLNILIFDLKVLDEAAFLDSTVEIDEVKLIDLQNYDISRATEMSLDVDLCWATYTLPFDRVENFYMVATCYHHSTPAIQYWEEKLEGEIIWYTAGVNTISSALDRLTLMLEESAREKEGAKTPEKA